jgi:2-phosphosulfolactate phosphatase
VNRNATGCAETAAAARDARDEPFRQSGAGVRFDWAVAGAKVLVSGPGALAIVDVLSFTTAVSVATGRGIAVVPYAFGSGGAAELAVSLGAELALPRGETSPERPWSLSPSSLLSAPHTPRLVLPSPNGSAIAAWVEAERRRRDPAGEDDVVVLAACLRNATATAQWLLARGYGTEERPVWLVGAGERWADGSLRPAIEDHLGAGALADGLQRGGCRLSPEAQVAVSTFTGTADLPAVIAGSASGRELASKGFPDDAAVAAELDADRQASCTEGGMFVRA